MLLAAHPKKIRKEALNKANNPKFKALFTKKRERSDKKKHKMISMINGYS